MEFIDETKFASIMTQASKKYVHGKICLLGDAACSQTPQLGIGLNASLLPVEDMIQRVTGPDCDWAEICKNIEEVHCEDQMVIRRVVQMSRNSLIKFLTPPFVMKFNINKYMMINYPGRFTTFQEGCWYSKIEFKYVE